MNKQELKSIEQELKDLLLFDSKWKLKSKRFSQDALSKIEVYRNLIKKSFSSVLGNIYPLTKKLLGNSWEKTIREYVEQYPPTSPILIEVGRNLPKYITEKKEIIKKIPYIGEVAIYEWFELEVYNYGDANKKNKLTLNPTGKIYSFEFPISKIITYIKTHSYKTFKKELTHLIIYRDPVTHLVRVFELTTGTKVYLELLSNGFSQQEIQETMFKAFKISNLKAFQKEFNKITSQLKNEKILL